MSTFSLPSSQRHHFKDRAFKRSFLVSFGIHAVVLIVAGSVTLFRMSGMTYAPSYTVDLVSLPAVKPATTPKPSIAPKPVQAEVKKPPKPAVKKAEPKPSPAPVPVSPPEKVREEVKPSGGDEAARLERRKKIEELEREAQRLYESIRVDGDTVSSADAQPAEKGGEDQPVTPTPSGAGGTMSDIRFRAYYDQIWAQIRSSWVLPEGVTTQASLLTKMRIRIASDGRIEQFWIEKKSGNDYYDQSTIRAITKTKHLPPLPEELGDGPFEVGINFRYPE